MSRTALQLASLRHMLITLKNDSSAVVTFKDVASYLDQEEADDLKKLISSYKNMNDYADVRAVELSLDAEAYWQRAQHALRATKLANNIGGDNAQLKKASKLCEQAAEFYDEVVRGTPSAAAFKEYPRDPKTPEDWAKGGRYWDDRWYDTVDYHIPLLITSFGKVVEPVRSAVMSVLQDIIEPRSIPENLLNKAPASIPAKGAQSALRKLASRLNR